MEIPGTRQLELTSRGVWPRLARHKAARDKQIGSRSDQSDVSRPMKHGWAPPTVVLSSNLRQVRRKECEFGAHDRERASGPFAAGSSGLYFLSCL